MSLREWEKIQEVLRGYVCGLIRPGMNQAFPSLRLDLFRAESAGKFILG